MFELLVALYIVAPAPEGKTREAALLMGFGMTEACALASRKGKGFEIWSLRASGKSVDKLKLAYGVVDCSKVKEAIE